MENQTILQPNLHENFKATNNKSNNNFNSNNNNNKDNNKGNFVVPSTEATPENEDLDPETTHTIYKLTNQFQDNSINFLEENFENYAKKEKVFIDTRPVSIGREILADLQCFDVLLPNLCPGCQVYCQKLLHKSSFEHKFYQNNKNLPNVRGRSVFHVRNNGSGESCEWEKNKSKENAEKTQKSPKMTKNRQD